MTADMIPYWVARAVEGCRPDFDQWLSAVKASAWDEGYEAGASFDDGMGDYVAPESNPYGATRINR